VRSGAQPQPKLNLVHFSVKYDIRCEQSYLLCKKLSDQIQCSLSNKSTKKHGGTTNFKMGATSNLRAKRAEKKWSIAELSHFATLCYAYFGILGNLPSKKSPSF